MVIISKNRSLVIKISAPNLVFGVNGERIYVDFIEDGVKLSYIVAEYANGQECRDVMEKVIKIQLEHGTIINPIDCIDFSKL